MVPSSTCCLTTWRPAVNNIVRTLIISMLVAAMALSILVGMLPYIIIATMLVRLMLHM